MKAQEGLAAAAVSADSTPDLAFEESAEGAAPEEDEDADPVSVEPLHDTLASITAQLSRSLATLTGINHVEAEISKYMATIEDLQTAIEYLDHCIAVDLDESVAARMQDL
jgi:hypothetical protein